MLKKIAKELLPKRVWNKLRSYKIDQMVDEFQGYIKEGVYGEHQLKVAIRDPLAEGWYGNDWAQLDEIKLLKKYKLSKGSKVFDFGAHQGVVAMMIAKEVGPTGKIIAVEANYHNYQVALENKKLNDLDQLQIIHNAVGEVNGEINFSKDLNGAIENKMTTTKVEKVPAFTVNYFIDNYFIPDVIFMDIEGFEALALKSSSRAFEENVDWFLEVHGPELIGRFDGTVSEVMSYFSKDNYDLYMSPGSGEFIPYDKKSSMIKERFLLVAIAK